MNRMSHFARVVMFKRFIQCFTATPFIVVVYEEKCILCQFVSHDGPRSCNYTVQPLCQLHSVWSLISGHSVYITKLEQANIDLIGLEQ